MEEPFDITPEIPREKHPPDRKKRKQFISDTLETILLALLLFLAINIVSARVRVEGYSMIPTLDNNQHVLISRLTPRFFPLKRGDIVVFRPPMYPEAGLFERLLGFPAIPTGYEDYIKRVIGLPGDKVIIADGEVMVNGFTLEEPYISAAPLYNGEWTIPEGNLFVLGDNRNSSSDSHSWSFLPIENVLGKAVLIYWPFSDWMVFKDNQPVMAAP